MDIMIQGDGEGECSGGTESEGRNITGSACLLPSQLLRARPRGKSITVGLGWAALRQARARRRQTSDS